jgi:hypothetical protein
MQPRESTDWLDTQTKAQLAAEPPEKLAPPTVGGFSLVLLERGADIERVDEALRRLVADGGPIRRGIPTKCPCVVRRGLSLPDALLGQFELICTDSVSVFVSDDVVRSATAEYLSGLFCRVRASPEFRQVTVRVDSAPSDDHGVRFLYRFFGHIPQLPAAQVVAHKKARIMQHWASKLGAVVEVADATDGAR